VTAQDLATEDTMQQFLAQTLPLVALAFLASSMFSLGLDLTTRQIVGPLRDRRLLGLALAANVVLVPLLAIAITRLVPMDPALAIGLVVYALAAGTEGGPKFVQLAKGNAGFAVGLLAVMLSITVVFMPLALSVLVPDAQIDRGSLLVKLFIAVVVPMGTGLLLRAHRAALADRLSAFMHRASLALLAVFFVQVIVVNYEAMLALQPGALLGALLFFALAFAVGYGLGGPRQENRRALAIMTFVRNAPISMTTASQVFPQDPGVLVMVTVLAALSVVLAVLAVVGFNRLPAQGTTVPSDEPLP
jgi:BASS family bile acid:Na+ symporter